MRFGIPESTRHPQPYIHLPMLANNRPASIKWLAVIMLLTTSMNGCAWFDRDEAEQQQKEVRNLYLRAKNALQQRSYVDALEKYKELESSFPFSPYARSASIEKAYAHYKNHQYEETVSILGWFIETNPDYGRLDYVYYLKGLAHYNYAQGPLGWILKRDRTDKDPTPLREGFFTFTELARKYPDGIYADDARLRAIALRNMLAVYEIRVADYYMRRQAYFAVINRCNYVLEHYPGASHTPEALWLLAEAYRRSGSPDLARDTLRIIDLNYPGLARKANRFGKISEKDRRSWGQNLKDLSDTILEALRIKPRY